MERRFVQTLIDERARLKNRLDGLEVEHQALLGNVLYYLQMVALRGPHVREPVEKALAVFLRMQPQTAPIFIEYAVVEVVPPRTTRLC